MSSTPYRPDIDGLRAVAVLLVVVFHSGFGVVSGGFIGVDVFFVISGFLITAIIHRETADRTFTYANFYKRRIRRLMPALFAMLFVTTVAASLILFPSDFKHYARSLLATALSLSNVYFWRENGGYFAGTTQEVPLLHTWSLAVEEQYYFTWPLFMMICRRLFNTRGTLIATSLLGIACLALSEYVARITFGAAYYLLPTRMFELMIGSILAIGWSRLPMISKRAADAASLTGLAMIVGSAVLLSSANRFPGINAAYPTVGAALIILSGRNDVGVVNRWLATRPMVFIGLISYSVYLWHWPLVAFAHYVGWEFTVPLSTAMVAGSLLLGALSWKYVELPFRQAGRSNFKATFAKLYAAPVLTSALIAVMVLQTQGMAWRFDPNIVAMDAAIATNAADLRGACHSPTRHAASPPLDNCAFGAQPAAAASTALLIGDSHANHFTGFVDEIAREANIVVYDYTLNTCLPVFELSWGPSPYYADICRRRNEQIAAHIASNRFDYVILAGQWPGEDDINKVFRNRSPLATSQELRTEFGARLRSTVEKIAASGARPVIIEDSVATVASPRCELVKASFNDSLICDRPAAGAIERFKFFRNIVAEMRKDFPRLLVIDPKEMMCDESVCRSAVAGVPLYLDSTHLNDSASRTLARLYLQDNANPFRPQENRRHMAMGKLE